jgi:polar amino acid transport system ATP-binding protein
MDSIADKGSAAGPAGAPAADPFIRFENVSLRYGGADGTLAVEGATIDIPKGGFVSIVGPSGCGKSTLLKMVSGLIAPTAGRVVVGGKPVTGPLGFVGMAFQNPTPLPWYSVIDNVMLAPRVVSKVPVEEARSRAVDLLDRVGLSSFAAARPTTLSGGQQQRVAIARALAMRPRVMLFDEPTSALDPTMTSEVLEVIVDLAKAGQTMVVVTHEIGFAREAAHRVVFMHQGKVWEQAPAKEFFADPKTPELKSFLSAVLH